MVRMGNGLDQTVDSGRAAPMVTSEFNLRRALKLGGVIFSAVKEVMEASCGQVAGVMEDKSPIDRTALLAKLNGTFHMDGEIPDGRVVLAQNHPFGYLDMMMMADHLAGLGRPWTVVSDPTLIEHFCPELAAHPNYVNHRIKIERADGGAANGEEVKAQAIDFLRKNPRGILNIAPIGLEDATFKRALSVGYPRRGFATMAHESGAQIVPVVFSGGDVDIKNPRFETRCRVLEAFEPFEDDAQTRTEWQKRMQEALNAASG